MFHSINSYFTILELMMTEERLIELEIKLAYQEDLLQTLNSIIAGQQKQISCLEETLLVLHERLKNLAFDDDNQLDNQPPPHY